MLNILHNTDNRIGVFWKFNSLAPVDFNYSLKLVNFRLISTTNTLSTFCKIAIRWMPQHLSDH